jgi:hypothetical protein
MAKRSLAMVGFVDSGVLTWKKSTNDEESFVVTGLGDRDALMLEIEVLTAGGHLTVTVQHLVSGINLVNPTQWLRYRVRKIASDSPLPTTVEVRHGVRPDRTDTVHDV